MVPDPFVNLDKILSTKSEKEVIEFEETVNDCIRDTGWLREYHLPINPSREEVRETVGRLVYS